MPRYVNTLAPRSSWAKKFEQRGRALVGHLLTNPTVFYDPMLSTANWLRTGTQPPAMSLVGTSQGGAIRFDTTAAAGQNSDIYLSNVAGAARSVLLTRPSTVAWYMAFRASFDTAIDAVAQMTGGLIDAALGTGGVQFGVIGSLSTAKFAAVSSASNALSSVNYAQGVHEIEFWGVGTTALLWRVDGESPVALTYGGGAVDGWTAWCTTINGVTAASRSWRLTDVLSLTSGL